MMLQGQVTVVSGREPPIVFMAILSLFALFGIGWLLYPLVRAWARRIEGKTGPDPALSQEVARLQERVQELEAHHGRVLELEERLDFAERLLAQARERDAARLPGQ